MVVITASMEVGVDVADDNQQPVIKATCSEKVYQKQLFPTGVQLGIVVYYNIHLFSDTKFFN